MSIKKSAYRGDIPFAIKSLADAIDDGVAIEDMIEFEIRFCNATTLNSDFSGVPARFLHWIFTSPELDLAGKATPEGVQAIDQVAELYRRVAEGGSPSDEDWNAAEAVAVHAYEAEAAVAVADSKDFDVTPYPARAVSDTLIAEGNSMTAMMAATIAAAGAVHAYAAASYGTPQRDATAAKAWKLIGDKLLELMASAPAIASEGGDE